ncbi:MAG: hypothetical protein WEA04_00475 [Candidatus Andersenbacteria bacterium]
MISACLVVVSAGIGIWQLREFVEQPAVAIDASREPELGLPVYAQFIVTQTIKMEEPTLVNKIRIPIYISSGSLPITVRLMRNENLVQEWQSPVDTMGIVEAEFLLTPPALLDGNIEVQFDGREISHNQKDTAPRLFTESFDAAYAQGNYRIAQNEKQGDVGLILYEEKTRAALFVDDFQESPLPQLARVCVWLSVLTLIAALPHSLTRRAAHTAADTSQQTF